MAESKTKEPAVSKIEAQFLDAWLDIENPELDGKNPHFNSKFATLKATLKVIREACKKAGIAYCQRLVKIDENTFELHSFVMNAAGETLTFSTFPVETPPNPQSFGSNMTYAKRQQAQADWSITGEEDDDGNAGAEAAKTASQRPTPTRTQQTNQRAANSRQNPPNANSNRANADEEKRAEYIARIKERRAEAEALGIKPDGIDSFIAATYRGRTIEELTLAELTTVGKHISGLIEDKKQLAAEKEQANG